jgi:hypothetical protein
MVKEAIRFLNGFDLNKMKMYLNNMRDVVKALTVFFRKERN